MTRYAVTIDDETGLFDNVRGSLKPDGTFAYGSNAPLHCCDELKHRVEFRCGDHPNLGSCPDYLIGYHPTFDEYGIWVHDGEHGGAFSWITIQHCPFCGAQLPPSRRDEWIARLDAADLECDEAPIELQQYGWWLTE